MKTTLPVIFLLFSLFALQCWAATTGSISGTVKDPSGAVIPGATVTVTNTANGIQYKTMADSKGDYTFPTLTPGRYDLEVTAEGFRVNKRTALIVNADGALRIDPA